MAEQAYCGERLMAALDGARLVKYDTAGVLYAWFGGSGVNVYDASGTEIDYWSISTEDGRCPSSEEIAESMARHLLDLDEVLERAEQAGYEAGKAAGSWLLDGNSTEDAARRLLDGIEDGDPAIMDALPCLPFSGEWADGLLSRDLLAEYDLDEEHDAADDVLRAFENAYLRGVVDEAVRSARALLGS